MFLSTNGHGGSVLKINDDPTRCTIPHPFAKVGQLYLEAFSEKFLHYDAHQPHITVRSFSPTKCTEFNVTRPARCSSLYINSRREPPQLIYTIWKARTFSNKVDLCSMIYRAWRDSTLQMLCGVGTLVSQIQMLGEIFQLAYRIISTLGETYFGSWQRRNYLAHFAWCPVARIQWHVRGMLSYSASSQMFFSCLQNTAVRPASEPTEESHSSLRIDILQSNLVKSFISI